MSDNLDKRRPQDSSRINIHEEWEVSYWCRALGCTRQQLIDAVRKVGVMVDDVRKELRK